MAEQDRRFKVKLVTKIADAIDLYSLKMHYYSVKLDILGTLPIPEYIGVTHSGMWWWKRKEAY